jgi:hypothetical protein
VPHRPTIASALAVLAALALLSLAAAACGGGTSSADKTRTAAAGAGTTPDTSDSPAAGATSPGGAGEGDEALRDIRTKFVDATFKATYLMRSPSDPDLDNARLTLEKRGRDRLRIELASTQSGENVSIIAIETPDVAVFCLNNAGELGALFGVEPGEGVCFNNDPTGGTPVESIRASLTDLEDPDTQLIDRSQRTIAGRRADCYTTRDSAGDTEIGCFDEDGVLLYAETAGSDASTLEAQSVSRDVNDNDFTPPYEIKDLPGFGDTETPEAP